MNVRLTRRALIAIGLATCATKAVARARPYVLSKQASRIVFTFTAGGIAQSGTVPVETADIVVNTADLSRSTAAVTADIRRVSSNNPLITEAIKSAELLDAARHPIVRFTSTAVRLGRSGRISEGARVEGQLTLRGVTRRITLDTTLSRPAGTAPDDLSTLFVELKGSFDRRSFGAVGYAGLAGNMINLDIRAEMTARA